MALLISIDDFREVCGLSDSFDSDYLEPMIVQATDLATEQVIGTALMVKIRTDFNNGALAGLYYTLWDSDKCSLKKMICWQAYQLCLPRMLYKIGAETISAGDTTEVTSIDANELGLLTRQADASRSMYENRVKKFLQSNQASIAELADTTLDYLRPNTEPTNTSMGLSFGENITYNNF